MAPPTEKQIKASLKEGGKKGQDVAGMNAMGGVKFFGVVVDSCLGRHELLTKVLEGMNKEVDEAADDRKGGAGDIGKILLNANDDQLIILCHVPDNLKGDIDQEEWFNAVISAVKAERVEEETPGLMRATLKANPDKEVFPLKERDNAVNASYNFLVSKSLVRPPESSDDENYAENANIEW